MIKNILPGGNQSTSFPSRITNNQGIELMDKKEIATTFNNFFVSVGSNLASVFTSYDTSQICPTVNQNIFSFSRVSVTTINKIISKLDNNKATRLDGISVRALKAGSPVLSIY